MCNTCIFKNANKKVEYAIQAANEMSLNHMKRSFFKLTPSYYGDQMVGAVSKFLPEV